MSSQKKTARRTGIRLTHHRRDWMAGLHWAPQHSVYLDLSATRLGSGARHSPLVDGSTESALRLGYLYRF